MKLMQKKNKKGFTLVELIIVVAVMAILVAVAVPTVISVVNNAKDATYDTNAQTILSTIKTGTAELIRKGTYDPDDSTKNTINADDFKKMLTDAAIDVGDEKTVFVYNMTDGTMSEKDEDLDGMTYTAATATDAAKIETDDSKVAKDTVLWYIVYDGSTTPTVATVKGTAA